MANDSFEYDVFISYSSADREWAKKLRDDLSARNRNIRCFFDQQSIRKGEKWEAQVLGSLLASRHFVLLWSNHAQASNWVQQELIRFKGEIDPKGDSPKSGRLLYAINLEGRNEVLNAYQSSDDPLIQKAYQEFLINKVLTFDAGQTAAWNQVLEDIVGESFQIPCAVLAMTQEIVNYSPPEVSDLKVQFKDFLENLGLSSVEDWKLRYDPKDPFQWKPFGRLTVTEILNNLLTQERTGINPKLVEVGQQPIRWSFIDIVTPPYSEVAQLAAPLRSGPSLLIIDPISLFSFQIYKRYANLGGCFANPQAVVVMLTPFAMHPPLAYLRECLSMQGRPNLDSYYEPIPYNPTFANCGIDIADILDVRRLVLTSLGRQRLVALPQAEAILGTGKVR